MEIRELRYFLAVAAEENVTRAAQALYIAQPSLSRQMQNLEAEIGQKLFVRGSRKITLTQAGLLLKKRAEEMLELYDKTRTELSGPSDDIAGTVCVGSGESHAVRLIARAAKELTERHPQIRFHFFSGDTNDVTERLDKGLIDFGILVEPADLDKYEHVRLPLTDTWGVLLRKDHPLAEKSEVSPADLRNVPLLRSKHTLGKNDLTSWFGDSPEEYNVVTTYTLIYNASLMVEEGLGCALTLDKLVNTTGESNLCFRPLSPRVETHLDVVWKKHSVFSKAAELFLEKVRNLSV